MAAMRNGNMVERVVPGSPAARAGIRRGDIILTLNRNRIRDSIDLLYYSDEPILNISLRREGKLRRIKIEREEAEPLGIELRPFPIKKCRNRCIFCFVRQLPKGLRKNLYIKDEDYRLSFLYGNYITLSNLTDSDKKRILKQHLSPLYISVHTTNNELRKKMLRGSASVDIMKELRWLYSHRLRFHAQIVLCPGYNDGEELIRTINDLQKFYPYILSIAVVPVGLTKHGNSELRHVHKNDAREALRIISDFQKRCRKKYGDPLVYGADELYIKAERKFPPLRLYGDLPQIENGVGMIPLFLSEMKDFCPPASSTPERRFLTITGTSFYPFLKEALEPFRERLPLEILPVENRFFGTSVTVTGLLTGRDIIYTLSETRKDGDILLLPDVLLRETDSVLLDDVSARDIEEILGLEVRIIDPSPAGLMKGLVENGQD